MLRNHSREFAAAALLFFSWAPPCLAAGAPQDAVSEAPSRGSLNLELDAAKNYLSAQGTASLNTGRRLLSSVDLNYNNTKTGDADDPVKSWSAGLALNKDAKILHGSLGVNYANDDQTRTGLGGAFSFGALWEVADGFSADLTLSGNTTRFSAAQSSSGTAGALKKRLAVDDSVAITQYAPTVALSFSFFDGLFSVNASNTRYRYQNYKAGSGLAGSTEQSDAEAGLKDTLVGGFIDWEWNAGAMVVFPWSMSLSGIYTESLGQDSQAWTKSLEGDLTKDIGDRFNVMLGLVHATENGSGDNTGKAGLTFLF